MDLIISEDSQVLNILLSAIGLLIFMALAVVLFFYFSRKKIVQSELEKANLQIEHQREVIQANLITQEAERKRIAQDLHDAISSKLNIVSLNANMLTQSDIPSEETNKIAGDILKVTTTVLESSRQIAHDLLPPTLKNFGLESALEELCDSLSDTKKFEVDYHSEYPNNTLSETSELHLFRITQELFSNAIKYSNASTVQLTLEKQEDIVSLQYVDDGRGFDLEKAKEAKGIGMSGIENRVAILNGSLQIETSEGAGMKLSVLVKLDAEEE